MRLARRILIRNGVAPFHTTIGLGEQPDLSRADVTRSADRVLIPSPRRDSFTFMANMTHTRLMTQVKMRKVKVLAVLTVLLGFAGCSSGPAPQVKTLDEVAKTLDLASISEIVCDYHFGPPRFFTSGVRYSRFIKLSGPEHIDAAIAELEAHGFVLDAEGKREVFTDLYGPQDVRAMIDVIAPPDDRIGTTLHRGKDDTCVIPEEGVTGVRLSLPS
ncbi:hypothetical protein GCM10027413_13740 [Conyzicola nivalis]|uniref:Uncharacterized protein n=1 Tax=Conyzicola nivalis TaxID=1477021 RepID=A0A916WHC4_9MICO|nr:hypothetical protein [Conyzicola nivalis]GGA99846.1 hypothetical protein GCM10010979_12890 [Conyzicola nivalis]